MVNAIFWQIESRYMYDMVEVFTKRTQPVPTDFDVNTQWFYKHIIVVLVSFYSGVWATKLSFLVFFRRLTAGLPGRHICWWTVFTLTVATYLVCIGDIQYRCLISPLDKVQENCSTHGALMYQKVALIINCIADVVTEYLSKLHVMSTKR